MELLPFTFMKKATIPLKDRFCYQKPMKRCEVIGLQWTVDAD